MEWDRKLSEALDGAHLRRRVGLIRHCRPTTLFAVHFCIKITYTALQCRRNDKLFRACTREM